MSWRAPKNKPQNATATRIRTILRGTMCPPSRSHSKARSCGAQGPVVGSAAARAPAVEFLRNKPGRGHCRVGKLGGNAEVPPSPYPRNALRGAGFAKSDGKIQMSKNLGVKTLRTLDLGASPLGWLQYARFGHDHAIRRVEARLDVTGGGGKTSAFPVSNTTNRSSVC